MAYDKTQEYTIAIVTKLQELFEEESNIFIDQDELLEGDNLTHFFQAVANKVPHFLYQHFTRKEVTALEFNHIANTLVFQYAINEDEQQP